MDYVALWYTSDFIATVLIIFIIISQSKMNITELKRQLKVLGAKTTGCKRVLENRLDTWKSKNLEETLFHVNVITVPEPEEYPADNYFKPLNLSGAIKLLNFEAIQCWFLPRKARKGMDRGRILAMKLFIKYTKIYQNGSCSYLKGNCCAEQKKTMEYNVRIKITSTSHNKYVINQCNCTCPAGTGWSAACKHIGAFCFSLEYFSVTGNPQEYVSCTAQAVQWNKPQGRGIGNMSIFEITGKGKEVINYNEEQDELINNLINNGIQCPLTLTRRVDINNYIHDHSLYYTAGSESPQDREEQYTSNEDIILRGALRRMFSLTSKLEVPFIPIKPNQRNFYNENIALNLDDALNIAFGTINQNNEMWKSHRKYRITGSRCYELYTYCSNKNPMWDNKIRNYINSSFAGNLYTEYGKNNENAAKNVYRKQYGRIYNAGLLINPLFPWLAFSPDGLKLYDGVVYKLIEIKCPFLGASKGVNDIINTLSYVKYDQNRLFPYYINRNHKYYGQVQLGMAILNLELCDFVIYSSYDDSCLVIEVERDDEFIKSLISKLQFVYFNYFVNNVINM